MTQLAKMEPPTEEAAPDRSRSRSPLATACGIAVIATLAYLGLSFAIPRSVPRLAVLPKPAASSTHYDDCNGRPGSRVTEQWERSGPIWTLTIIRLGGECIPE